MPRACSAERGFIGIETGVPESWQDIVAALQEKEALLEGLLIAQVTGGTAPRTHVPPVAPVPSFFCYLRAFRFPREAEVAVGIQAISGVDLRWGHSDLKTTMLLPGVLAKRKAIGQGAREALLLGSDGVLHEGAASNVFLVEGRRLLTPEQDEHLLPGLTRPLVERLAVPAGLDVETARIPLERLRRADEVFVTSTTFLVMPVTHLDGAPIGSGKSGPVARELAARLRAELELEEC